MKHIDSTTGEEMHDCAGWTRRILRRIIQWALADCYKALD